MSLPHLVMWAVVLGVAFPAAFRNPTAGALAGCYLFAELVYRVTGNGLAVEFFIVPDIAVLAVIFAKPERYPCEEYHGAVHQLWCLVSERSIADRFIMCSYPFVWLTYAADISDYTKYWALWVFAIAQYLAAGSEALFDQVHRRNADAASPPEHSGSLLVACFVGGRFA